MNLLIYLHISLWLVLSGSSALISKTMFYLIFIKQTRQRGLPTKEIVKWQLQRNQYSCVMMEA